MKFDNLLFIHDGPIYHDGEERFYEYSYPNLNERYSFFAKRVSFLMRVFPLTENTRGNIIPKEVNIIPIPNIGDIKKYFFVRKDVKRIVGSTLDDIDVVVIRCSLAGHLALKEIKRRNIPYIYECVGCIWDSYWNHGLIGKMLAPYMFFTTRKIIKESKYVYYVTNEFLQKRYPTKGKFIGCSNVYLDAVDISVLENRLKKNRAVSQEKKIILGTAAAIDVRYKGQEYVIKSLPTLIKKGYNVEYWLAGGNRKNSDYLFKIAQKYGVTDKVKFCGSLNKQEIEEFYDSIDIYVQPSKQEGLPRALIEAMSRGCVAMGSSVAGIPELLEKQFLFKKGSHKEIIESFERIINTDFDKVSKRNFEFAKQYNKDRLEIKRRDFYSNFVDENIS